MMVGEEFAEIVAKDVEVVGLFEHSNLGHTHAVV